MLCINTRLYSTSRPGGTRGTGGTCRPRGTSRAGRARGTGCTGRPRRTSRTGGTGGTRCPSCASGAGSPSQTNWSGGAHGAGGSHDL